MRSTSRCCATQSAGWAIACRTGEQTIGPMSGSRWRNLQNFPDTTAATIFALCGWEVQALMHAAELLAHRGSGGGCVSAPHGLEDVAVPARVHNGDRRRFRQL